MSDAFADKVIAQCLKVTTAPDDLFLIESFNQRLDAFAALHAELSAEQIAGYKSANRHTIATSLVAAYQLLLDTMRELKEINNDTAPPRLADTAQGQDYYQRYVRHSPGTDKTIAEIRTELLTFSAQLRRQLEELEATHPDLFDAMTDASSSGVLSGEPRENLPAVLYDYTNPAMYLKSPFDRLEDNSILLGDPSSVYDLFTTVAHEGVPGHLYQRTYLLNQQTDAARCLMESLGYVEGWATYVESLSYKYGGLEEWLASGMELDILYLYTLYALSDIGINYEGWDETRLRQFLRTDDMDWVKNVYDLVSNAPGTYLPYAYGAYKFRSMRESVAATWGADFSLKRFHKLLMDIGPWRFPILDKIFAEKLMN